MMKKIIVITDLGHFRAYKVTKESGESPRITLIEGYDSVDGHGKLGDKLSDTAGRFPGGGGKNETSRGYGEAHNIPLEIQKKLIKMIVRDIHTLIDREDCEEWYLAAGKKMNRQIVDSLRPEIRARLVKNLASDLTKVRKSEILSHFKQKKRS